MRCFPRTRGGSEGLGGVPSASGVSGRCPSPAAPRRYERLEEQLNDLTELHQNEMTNLKQELASMEEKVAYQSYERARDIQVGLWQGSAPLCSLQPRGEGQALGWEGGWGGGIPSPSSLQVRLSLRCCHR